MKNLKGSGVAMITPFNEDKSIDYAALERVVEHVIAEGIDYLVVQGTTGETATLTSSEKKEVLAFTIKVNKERVPIVYGIGGNATQKVLEEIENTDFTGIDAILSVSPYYNKPSQEGIITHYQHIADTSPVPVILYNVPGRTMSNMTAETTLTLSAHQNIIGMKESSGNLEQCMKIAAHKPDDFILISGDDMLGCAVRAIGGEGIISVMANAYPSLFRSIMHDDPEASRKAAFQLLEMNPLMYEESNPVGIKNLMMHLGLCKEDVRLPLVAASASLSQRIKAASLKI
jgi:4-hydroxy-tetrahydrodipicolinate synthase